jgi:hypothetical protein
MAITEKLVLDMADDLTGDDIPEGGGRTVRFGLGTPTEFEMYELELTTANEKELQDFLDRYKSAARRVKPEPIKRGRTSPTPDFEIRKWAREQGFDVPARGRIAEDVRSAYKSRHKATAKPGSTVSE